MVVDVDMIVEAAPAQVIDQLVAGDRAHPRFERLRLVPGVALQMHGEQSLLNDVLAVAPGRAPAASRPRRTTPRSHTATWPSSRR